MSGRSSVAAVALLVALAPAAMAQTTGAIEGIVRDPAGATVGGASIQIVETATGAVRRLASDGVGRYLALGLAPGTYDIQVSHNGFREESRRGVELGAGRDARIDFVLRLGEAREQIVVHADAPLVSTASADWGASVATQRLDSLPLNGRDLFELSSQELGAAVPRSSARAAPENGVGLHVSVNGARTNQNSFQLDGIYINDPVGSAPASAAGQLLGLEAVRELRVMTNPFSAEYGRTAGGAFIAVSKSGTNQFHGSLYEFLRNSALDAKNFFDPAGPKTPPLRRNQFGGILGGPLRRDRVFFLVNYEAIREAQSQTVRPAVPTAEAKQGLLPVGGGVQHVTVSAAVMPYLNLYPLPNGRDFGDGTAEFINDSATSTREDYVAGKIDFLASPKLRFSGRYTYDAADTGTPDPLRIWRFVTTSGNQFVHTDTQYVYSPQTIDNFRAGFSRVRRLEIATVAVDVPAALSFVPGQQLGSIRVTGLNDFGGTPARLQPRLSVLNEFQLNDDLVQIRGRHTLKLGGGFNRVQFNQVANLSAVGQYQFTSLLDLLEAQPQSAELMLPGSETHRGWRQNQIFAYLQDDYRATPGLSFSLGVRYETYSVPTEVNGKIATLRDPLHDTAVTVGGPLYRNPSKRNFAPRASVAWDPLGTGTTVLRAGAGIFFDLLSTRELFVSGVRMPPFFNLLNLRQPSFPNLFEAARNAAPPNSLDGLDFYPNQPYVAQFQFAVERELGPSTLLRMGYAGARGIHLAGQLGNINATQPQTLPGGRLYFPPGAPRLNPAFDSIGMRRTQFNSYYHALLVAVERRWAHGFQFQGKYTWSHSIDETSNATFNDFLNSDQMPVMFNYRQNRGSSDFDLRHLFSANVSYQLPSPHDGVAAKALGGWSLDAIAQAQTGSPFAPVVGFDRANLRPGSGDLGQRPDFAGASSTSLVLGDPQRYFDPTAFALPAAGFYGNLGRGTITGPGLVSLDLAAHKVLWQRERQSVRVRVEAFNVANHPNFAIPSGRAVFNSSLGRVGSAGRITATSTSSRQIQVAARWTF